MPKRKANSLPAQVKAVRSARLHTQRPLGRPDIVATQSQSVLPEVENNSQASVLEDQQQHDNGYTYDNIFHVWVCGSSLVTGASNRASERPDGHNIGMENLGVKVTWLGMSGMRVHHLKETISYHLQFNPKPDMLIIHCGGNDIRCQDRPGLELSWKLKKCIYDGNDDYDLNGDIESIQQKLPNCRMIYSQILPRLTWRYYANHREIANRIRKRVNSCIGAYTVRKGGGYIKYPNITEDPRFFSDGTHLSSLGYDIMLNTIGSAIYSFKCLGNSTYPVS